MLGTQQRTMSMISKHRAWCRLAWAPSRQRCRQSQVLLRADVPGEGDLAPALLRAPPEQGRRKGWVGDRTRISFLSTGLHELELSPESLGGLVKKPDCCSRGSAPKVSNLKGLGWALESAFLTISPVSTGAPALGPPAFGKHDSRC